MNNTVRLLANTPNHPDGGGHLWVHLSWALRLRSPGCHAALAHRCDGWLEDDRGHNGLFRLRSPEEAALRVKTVVDDAGDYETQCGLAPAFAGEVLTAHNVAGRVLERALA